ncbi:MAG: 16S rRNA (cytosine(1402)-N(4))-methyltransferase RsmH [Porphyromonas sp.]|nr:16S rRNA (cytosine(1402)-N(4))-methyltransferase RsmH [Porphyromonas sp.]
MRRTPHSTPDITVAEGYHVPVLLQETLDALDIKPDGVYVDCTFGGGGHSKAIVERLSSKGLLIAIDQDEDAIRNIPEGEKRILFVHGNFRYLRHYLAYIGIEKVDGILADLGVSSHHFDDPDRGFSFRFDAPLDMRMNARQKQTAADLLVSATEEELALILKNYGELNQPYRIAKIIKQAIAKGTPLRTVNDLIGILSPSVFRENDKKNLAKLFQALRIELNDEMGALQDLLKYSRELLAEDGRIAIITYHSLEDRPVKNFFRYGNMEGTREVDMYGNVISSMCSLFKKAVVPSAEEINRNPRSRSAKLRVGVSNPNIESVSDSI